MLAFQLIANVKRELDDTRTYRVREVKNWRCLPVCSQSCLKPESSESHSATHTHLSPHTQEHWSTAGITSDPWLGSHWALLVCVSVSRPTGTPVCAHSMCYFEVVCAWVCIFVSVEGLRGRKKEWKTTGERGREGGIKAERWQRGRWKRHRQESMPSFSLSLSLPPSPTHSSKYCDHRKVISKLSQSEDNEPTESHRKKHRKRVILEKPFFGFVCL